MKTKEKSIVFRKKKGAKKKKTLTLFRSEGKEA